MLLLLIIFFVGCAAAAAGACAAYNISTEAERGTGYCFFLLRFCPLDCDASVMVVDCAAVETGWMLEKYIEVVPLLRVLPQKGIYTYLVRIQNFLFHFLFDEIYRRLLFFTLGRSVSA